MTRETRIQHQRKIEKDKFEFILIGTDTPEKAITGIMVKIHDFDEQVPDKNFWMILLEFVSGDRSEAGFSEVDEFAHYLDITLGDYEFTLVARGHNNTSVIMKPSGLNEHSHHFLPVLKKALAQAQKFEMMCQAVDFIQSPEAPLALKTWDKEKLHLYAVICDGAILIHRQYGFPLADEVIVQLQEFNQAAAKKIYNY